MSYLIRFFLYSAVFFIIFPGPLHCFSGKKKKSLHPPLDGELIVTGTVGEYRPNHFHRGLDFSTGNEVGKKVYAIDEGFVSKLAYHRYGIGLAVWIRHPGNRESLYGHLNDFAPEILNHPAIPAEIREKAERRQEFTISFEDDSISVSRGMHIAFSGESGIGLPHLHMEYKVDGIYVNPLLYGLPVNDTTPPVIDEISIVPLSARSRINGKAEPFSLKLMEAFPQPMKESGGYRMDYVVFHDPKSKQARSEPEIRITGPVGIIVTGWDPFSKSRLGYKTGSLYEVPLSGNKQKSEKIFSFDLNYLNPGAGDIEAFRNILLYDGLRSKISGGTTYAHYFFERIPGSLSFTESENEGIIEFDSGEPEKKIIAEAADSFGNYSQFSVLFRKDTAVYGDVQGFQAFTGIDSEEILLESEDGLFRVKIPEGKKIGNFRLSVSQNGTAPRLPAGLSLQSKVYTIAPSTRDFLTWYEAEIKGNSASKTDVYRIDGNSIRRIESEKSENRFFFRQHVTGSFALIKDTTAPVWLPPKIVMTGDRGRRLLLYARDTGSGINPETAEVTINGKKVFTDFDADRNHLEVVYPKNVLAKGNYVLQAVISDMAGNVSDKVTFRYNIP